MTRPRQPALHAVTTRSRTNMVPIPVQSEDHRIPPGPSSAIVTRSR